MPPAGGTGGRNPIPASAGQVQREGPTKDRVLPLPCGAAPVGEGRLRRQGAMSDGGTAHRESGQVRRFQGREVLSATSSKDAPMPGFVKLTDAASGETFHQANQYSLRS